MDDFVPRCVTVGGEQITAPIKPEVDAALRRWEESKFDELVEVLAPFGLHPYGMAAPIYRRIVQPAEMRELIGDSDD